MTNPIIEFGRKYYEERERKQKEMEAEKAEKEKEQADMLLREFEAAFPFVLDTIKQSGIEYVAIPDSVMGDSKIRFRYVSPNSPTGISENFEISLISRSAYKINEMQAFGEWPQEDLLLALYNVFFKYRTIVTSSLDKKNDHE